ncbi:MAG: thiol:disulfide interchange protein DsbG [Burkholderiaceae bacterium]
MTNSTVTRHATAAVQWRHTLRATLISASFFAVSAPGQAADYPKPIQEAVANGVKVVKTFPAASSLTGWVLSQGADMSLVYTTPDGKTLIVGELIDEHGQPLSKQYASQYMPKPDQTALYREIEQADAVTEGTLVNPKSLLYVFFDANCPYCHFTWKALQPYEKAGLQVKWVPVAVLGETSLPKAIAVMSASDRTAAFRTMQEQFVPGKPSAAPTAMPAKPGVAEGIRRNGVLMERFGINGTPGVVWKDHAGKIQTKGGMPRLSELPSITHLPEQKVDAPELQKFK